MGQKREGRDLECSLQAGPEQDSRTDKVEKRHIQTAGESLPDRQCEGGAPPYRWGEGCSQIVWEKGALKQMVWRKGTPEQVGWGRGTPVRVWRRTTPSAEAMASVSTEAELGEGLQSQ